VHLKVWIVAQRGPLGQRAAFSLRLRFKAQLSPAILACAPTMA
jgi:hypothetical protein